MPLEADFPEDPGTHRFVFIAGLHRSGTSFFHKALQQHPEISGFTGTGVPEDEGQHLQTVFPPGMAFGGPGRFAFHPEAHLTEDSPLCTPATADQLLRDWSPFWNLEKPVLIEKSPPNLLKTRFLQGLFPNACFVVILRHPVPVTIATLRVQKPSATIDDVLRHWVHAYGLFEDDRPCLRHVAVVRYEDLMADANKVMDGVFRFIGVEPHPVHIEIDATSNARYFASWNQFRLQNKQLTKEIIDRLNPDVERFGYSLTELPGSF